MNRGIMLLTGLLCLLLIVLDCGGMACPPLGHTYKYRFIG